MIRKESIPGVKYSVVDLNGVRHVFADAVPSAGGDWESQAREALGTLDAMARREGIAGSIVTQTVFLSDLRQVETCRRIICEFYGENLPATTYVPQPPCGGKLLEIEVMGVDCSGGKIEISRLSEKTVIAKHDDIVWVHCAHLVPQTPAETIYDRSLDVFHQVDSELAAGGSRFEQVIRTWIYLGDITGPEGESQRYKKLNRARTDFFKDKIFLQDRLPDGSARVHYPASTGIGADGREVIVSCLALVTDRADVIRLPLENPRQVSAHDYDHRYGSQSPKFSRAMAIISGDEACVLVSGTASIIDSETHHIGNVQAQTRETLDNIAALISKDNFRRHSQNGLGATLDDMVMARVYIKRQEDYPVVRDACRARLGDLPIVYAVADVCRPELLVEIEGVAFCKRDDR